jgi:hypothetical protein
MAEFNKKSAFREHNKLEQMTEFLKLHDNLTLILEVWVLEL